MGITIVGAKSKVDHFGGEQDKAVREWLVVLKDRHADGPDWRKALRLLRLCHQVMAKAPGRSEAADHLHKEIERAVLARSDGGTPRAR